MNTTPSQAWSILERHAREEISSLRLQELCSDNKRVASLVAVHTSNPQLNSSASNHARKNGPQHVQTDFMEIPHVLIADISRQKMTMDTLQNLLRLSHARRLRDFIDLVAWGKFGAARFKNLHQDDLTAGTMMNRGRHNGGNDDDNNNNNNGTGEKEDAFPMYVALRAPPEQGMLMLGSDGSNVCDAVHAEWRRIEELSNSIRSGKTKGISGEQIRDVVVVGRGVAVASLKFFYDALRRDISAGPHRVLGSTIGVSNRPLPPRRLRFVTSIDPANAEAAVADLSPSSTLVISIVLSDDSELSLATQTMRSWLVNGLKKYKRQTVEDKHMLVIAASTEIYMKHLNNVQRKSTAKNQNLFILPKYCCQSEAFSTFTAAGLVPLSIIFGWTIVSEIISGAHDIDIHFVESNFCHNLPVLLALTDFWNDGLLSHPGRVFTPFSQPFHGFPEFVSMLESETCAGKVGSNGNASAGAVFPGGSSGEFDRMLYQGGRGLPSELIIAMDTQAFIGVAKDPVKSQHAQDMAMCSFFAHADLLAFGNHQRSQHSRQFFGRKSQMRQEFSDGNRPTTLLICGRTDAYTCGQLISLSEHRAATKAWLFGANPFSTSATVGSAMRSSEIDRLSERLFRMYEKGLEGNDAYDEENDNVGDGKVNLATSTILNHYANRMHDQKIYVVK